MRCAQASRGAQRVLSNCSQTRRTDLFLLRGLRGPPCFLRVKKPSGVFGATASYGASCENTLHPGSWRRQAKRLHAPDRAPVRRGGTGLCVVQMLRRGLSFLRRPGDRVSGSACRRAQWRPADCRCVARARADARHQPHWSLRFAVRTGAVHQTQGRHRLHGASHFAGQTEIVQRARKPAFPVAVELEMALRRLHRPTAHALGDIGVLQQIPLLIDDDMKRRAPFEISVLDKMLPGGLDGSGFDGLRDIRVLREIPGLYSMSMPASRRRSTSRKSSYNPVQSRPLGFANR